MFNYVNVPESDLEFFDVATPEEIPPGERLFLTIGSVQLVMLNLAGTVFALGDVCSHDNGPLGDGEVDEDKIVCPRHGARFDIRSGKAEGLPVVVDIPAYPVRKRDGMYQVGIPKE